MKIFLPLIVILSTVLKSVKSIDNGLARTPQMGWNSWNHYFCDGLNQDVVLQTAQIIVDQGYKDAGYEYVNIDDCWQVGRDPKTGKIIVDEEKFPDGIKSLVDKIHNLGLKFGLYSDAGTHTCGGRPGSLGYEVIDAQTYADWGVDYLKYDNCYNEGINVKYRYEVMYQALNYTGHPILFSMCEWGVEDPWTWGPEIANSWRTTDDVRDNFKSVVYIIEQEKDLWKYAGPGQWNDADMLEVGNGGMTTQQYQFQFAFWSLLKSPLLIGCDMTDMSDDTIKILKNTDVISVNQDLLGKQGVQLQKFDDWQLWATPMADQSTVILIWNSSESLLTMTFTFQEICANLSKFDYPCYLYQEAEVRDLIEQENLENAYGQIQLQVESMYIRMIKLTPVSNFIYAD